MIKLIIALDCTVKPCRSTGTLSYNGYDFTFSSDEDNLYVKNVTAECTNEIYKVKTIFLYGIGDDLHSSRYDVDINLCDTKQFTYKSNNS